MMNFQKALTKSVLGAGLLLLVFANDAHAYLDPGTGSYILQLIMAALFGTLFITKIYWGKIKTFLLDLFKKSSEE